MVQVLYDDFAGRVHHTGARRKQLPPLSGFSYFKSLQQIVLSRAFMEYALWSSDARRMLLLMATSE